MRHLPEVASDSGVRQPTGTLAGPVMCTPLERDSPESADKRKTHPRAGVRKPEPLTITVIPVCFEGHHGFKG